MQSVSRERQQYIWGAAGLALFGIVCLVAGLLYVTPPGQQSVEFYTDDAISVHPGDTVRIAGIVVGKVTGLSLEPNSVKVRASVDRDAFVGDQSQIEVRMLTVVGGYFVTILSLGDKPIGKTAIPKDRVTMPYSLIQVLTDTTKITEHVAPEPIKDSINQVQQGVSDENVDVLTELLRAGNNLTDSLRRQRGQIASILNTSNEYIDRLNENKQLIDYMISRMAVIEETLALYRKGFAGAIEKFGQVILRLQEPLHMYMDHRTDWLQRLKGIQGEYQAIADRTGNASGYLQRILRRLRWRMELSIDQQDADTRPELLATDLCIPIEGAPC
jgi:phospholipid/cholesterol/gamma-HCH transport system substrate-binding protein